MITANCIRKSYGTQGAETVVLKNGSLEIKDGEFVAILGASGSGKSTLLSILSGLEKADGGSVVCDGEELSAFDERSLTDFRRRKVGFVFQQYFLLPHLTVEQNIKMGAALGGGNVREILSALGFSEKRKKLPRQLSGGEQQRVSIARALAKQPKILFLDEPTGALDEETGRSVLNYLAERQREIGFTVVMVTHNRNFADMADRVFEMGDRTIAKVFHNPKPKNAYEIGW